MTTPSRRSLLLLLALAGLAGQTGLAAGASPAPESTSLRNEVDRAIAPLMQRFAIPGMAVAVSVGGQRHYYTYGIASRETRQAVTRNTLFEIGSISKTFTATLATYAEVTGKLALSQSPSDFFPELKGSHFDDVTLLNLGTHTSGGLPLQAPDGIADEQALLAYFNDWQPLHKPGTRRAYSNPSIGLLGMAATKSLGGDFEELTTRLVMAPLGLTHTYYHVPASEMARYATGYTSAESPARVNPGVIDAQAYGVKSDAVDMLRWAEAVMRSGKSATPLGRALAQTRTAHYRFGPMTQDLIWEQYPDPVTDEALAEGNGSDMVLKPVRAEAISPPLAADDQVLVNKTGSTNGFSAYVAFVPARDIAIVILSNKNHPNVPRVAAAHQILRALDSASNGKRASASRPETASTRP